MTPEYESATPQIDRAEGHHDMALRDEDGKVFAIRRIGRGATGFAKVPALIAAHGGGPNLTPSPIGTDKNLLVIALTRAGFTLSDQPSS